MSVNKTHLIELLTRAGYMTAADNVRGGVLPGRFPVTLEEIADHYEQHGQGEAGRIIRRQIVAAEREAQVELDDAINYQASAAERVIRDAAGFQGGTPDRLEEIVGKADEMAQRLMDETGLDAADNLTWHVRQAILNTSRRVREVEELTAEHLAARDDCPSCGGDNCVGGLGGSVESDNTECPRCGPSGKVKRYPHQLGEVLKDWFEELCGVGGLAQINDGEVSTFELTGTDSGSLELPEFASTMIQAALAWVDWDDLARDAISTYEANHGDDGERS